MTVSATVQATCVIAVSSLGFGAYANAAVPGTASLTITCSNTTGFKVTIDSGLNPSGFYGWRLTGPSGALLSYRIYRDSNRTSYWGGTAGLDSVDGTGTGVPQNLTFYGLILSGQTAAVPGAYADTVVVTMAF